MAQIEDTAVGTGRDSFASAPPVRGAWIALVLLLGINLFNYVDRQVLAAVELPIEKEFGKSEAAMGTLATVFLFSYMLVAPVFGRLADRVSRWILVAIGVILWSLASGASGWARSFEMLLITRCFVGIGEAAYGPVAPTILSDLYPVRERGRVLSLFYLAIPVGSALGYTLGGSIASHMGWRWAFYVVVPPGILLGLWALFMKEPPRGAADVAAPVRRHNVLRDYLTVLRTPSYLLDTLGMAAMTFAIGGIGFWMPRYIFHDRHFGTLASVNFTFGGITVVSGLLATVLGGIVGDKLRTRFSGSYFLVSGAGMIAGFPLFLAVLFTPFPLAWVFIFLAVFCLFFNTGPSNTILANVTHPSIRASGFALNILIIHALGDAVSPPLIGAISGKWGMNVAFGCVSVLMFVGGLIWLWGAKYLEQDTINASGANPHGFDVVLTPTPVS